MSLDQQLEMFSGGNVVDIVNLEIGVYSLILKVFKTDYGQIILKLHNHWASNIYVWLPRNYNHHFPSEIISHINSENVFLRIKYVGSYLKYVFLEFHVIE